MNAYDYKRETGLWENNEIAYTLNDKSSYSYEDARVKTYSADVFQYVQIMKEQGIKTIVSMNNYLTKNNLWNAFKSIQRMNTYSTGFSSVGVSRAAYSEIMDLYKTNDVINTRLELSEILS